jgi:hypothetical protein
MKLIYGVGFTDEDRVNFTHVVHSNVMTSMRALVQACEDFDFAVVCQVASAAPLHVKLLLCAASRLPRAPARRHRRRRGRRRRRLCALAVGESTADGARHVVLP